MPRGPSDPRRVDLGRWTARACEGWAARASSSGQKWRIGACSRRGPPHGRQRRRGGAGHLQGPPLSGRPTRTGSSKGCSSPPGRSRPRTSTSTCATSTRTSAMLLTAEIAPTRGRRASSTLPESTSGAAPGRISAAKRRRCSKASKGSAGYPRQKPPFPTLRSGLFGRPTLIHNVETVYWVRDDPRTRPRTGSTGRGPERAIGPAELLGLGAREAEPGVKLAPAGITCPPTDRRILRRDARTATPSSAYLPGGASGGILPASLADVPARLRHAGALRLLHRVGRRGRPLRPRRRPRRRAEPDAVLRRRELRPVYPLPRAGPRRPCKLMTRPEWDGTPPHRAEHRDARRLDLRARPGGAQPAALRLAILSRGPPMNHRPGRHRRRPRAPRSGGRVDRLLARRPRRRGPARRDDLAGRPPRRGRDPPPLLQARSPAIGPTATAGRAWSRSPASACSPPPASADPHARHEGHPDRLGPGRKRPRDGDGTPARRHATLAKRTTPTRILAVGRDRSGVTESRFPPDTRSPAPTSVTRRCPSTSTPASSADCASGPAARSRSTTSSGWRCRGHAAKVVFDFDDPMGRSTCVACGECVQACPTGALMPASAARCDAGKKAHARPTGQGREPLPLLRRRLPAHLSRSRTNRILHVEGRDGPANHNRLCVKGRFGFDYVHHAEPPDDAPSSACPASRGKAPTTRVDPGRTPRPTSARRAGTRPSTSPPSGLVPASGTNDRADAPWRGSGRRRGRTRRRTSSRSSSARVSAAIMSTTARDFATPRPSRRLMETIGSGAVTAPFADCANSPTSSSSSAPTRRSTIRSPRPSSRTPRSGARSSS